MKARMKRSYFRQLISLSLVIIVLINPISTALASTANQPVSAQPAVTASAVIVPEHVAQLGLLISGIAKEVPAQEGDKVKAGQTLLVLDTPDLEFAVVEAQAALHSAQAYADLQKYKRIKSKRNGKIFYDVIPIEVRQRADVKVQQAQAMLQLAQLRLTENTLIAPLDGTVTALAVIPGEFAQSDQAVVTLATLDKLQLETTDLSERDITRVNVGAPADIFIEALNQHINGKVLSISPKADTVGGDVVFKVTLAFEEQPKNALWGMTAEVTIRE